MQGGTGSKDTAGTATYHPVNDVRIKGYEGATCVGLRSTRTYTTHEPNPRRWQIRRNMSMHMSIPLSSQALPHKVRSQETSCTIATPSSISWLDDARRRWLSRHPLSMSHTHRHMSPNSPAADRHLRMRTQRVSAVHRLRAVRGRTCHRPKSLKMPTSHP